MTNLTIGTPCSGWSITTSPATGTITTSAGTSLLLWGNWRNETNKDLSPNRIFINGRTLVVEWDDGTKTQSTASINDVFDPEVGFGICLAKKLFGKKVFGRKLYRRFIRKAIVQNMEENAQRDWNEWLSQYKEDGRESKKNNDELPF